MRTTQIHLLWKGPYTHDAVVMMDGSTDYGVYQIYGDHPVYGLGALLYIGQARKATFASRFKEHTWMTHEWGENATASRIYTGRIHKTEEEAHPSNDRWEELIRTAEKLLISAHSPAGNAQDVGELKSSETDQYKHFHVFNWGQYASLLPEVSGARYTWAVYEQVEDEPLSAAG